jgi:hypothetical protein
MARPLSAQLISALELNQQGFHFLNMRRGM